MGTSRPRGAVRSAGARVLGYVGSTRHVVGAVAGLVALGATVPTGIAGPYWPVVVGGVYGLGALLAPDDAPKSAASARGESEPGVSPASRLRGLGAASGRRTRAEPARPAPHREPAFGSWLENDQVPPAGSHLDLDLPTPRREGPSPTGSL